MKATFVLRSDYADVFFALSDAQAGALIKRIYAHVTSRTPQPQTDKEVAMAFTFIKQDLDFDSQKYEQICAKRAENGRKGGRAKSSKRSICLPPENQALASNTKHSECECDSESDSVCESDINILTADRSPQDTSPSFALPSGKPRPLQTQLEAFAREVARRFEPHVKSQAQHAVWLKRNARCLRDIWQFCGQDTALALQTIAACQERLHQAGLSGGYEAVLRNIPQYYAQARQAMQPNPPTPPAAAPPEALGPKKELVSYVDEHGMARCRWVWVQPGQSLQDAATALRQRLDVQRQAAPDPSPGPGPGT